MLRPGEGDEGRIEAICLPIGVIVAPTISMSGETEKNVVPAYVLCSLIRITATSSRRAYQSQPQSLVVGFVGTILAVGKYSYTVGPVLIRQIDPLMRGDFELTLLGIRSLHCADVPVVSRHPVRSCQRE